MLTHENDDYCLVVIGHSPKQSIGFGGTFSFVIIAYALFVVTAGRRGIVISSRS